MESPDWQKVLVDTFNRRSLEHLIPILEQHKIGPTNILELTEEDLAGMGVGVVGDRKAAMVAIEAFADELRGHTGRPVIKNVMLLAAIVASLAFLLIFTDPTGGFGGAIVIGAVAFFATLAFLLPTIVAGYNLNQSALWIFVLNIVFGWTGIGWVLVGLYAWLR